MKPLIECNICYKRGDGYWAGWHKRVIGHNDFNFLYEDEDEPPSKGDKDSFKLCLSGSRDLRSLVFGCGINPQSRYHFGSLVMLGSVR